ncbi:predicted protein [Aspergillus terreus NIH2624]|uniref:Uncharacterized protein n=1 Tax=Aspergillus terreus (strain NIH 2624 / FGSC A1156) TaxID=341663 RepID=Q0CGI3_ASPTN|nr:uncharacterized protein ATEG_07209 [Aspergillus terreus NIH2624]EAU32593.1 predicted protein [Aspergillus terreus NIH2624]
MAGKAKHKNKSRGNAKKKTSGKSVSRPSISLFRLLNTSLRSSATRDSKNENPSQGADIGQFSEEISSQLESAYQIRETSGVELSLPLPQVPEQDEPEDENHSNNNQTAPDADTVAQRSPRANSFTRRLRSFTGGSATSIQLARSLSDKQPQSPSKQSQDGRSLRSDSVATQNTNRSATSTSSTLKSVLLSPKKNRSRPAAKRSFTAPSAKYYYGSPQDFMFVDADFGKSKEKPVHDGPLPRSKDAMRQISTKPQTSNGELQGEYHRVALHAKVPARARQMAKDTFEELIDYIRSVTGTEVKFRDLSESEAHRVDDVRTWDSVNLRCTSCRVDCGLCGAACCVYENARRTVAKAGPGADGVARERAAKASQMIKVIESLGPQAKDVSTFSLCSQPGGCGRYECKPNPWENCDWHD